MTLYLVGLGVGARVGAAVGERVGRGVGAGFGANVVGTAELVGPGVGAAVGGATQFDAVRPHGPRRLPPRQWERRARQVRRSDSVSVLSNDFLLSRA